LRSRLTVLPHQTLSELHVSFLAVKFSWNSWDIYFVVNGHLGLELLIINR
jgi:hypothetical protein